MSTGNYNTNQTRSFTHLDFVCVNTLAETFL